MARAHNVIFTNGRFHCWAGCHRDIDNAEGDGHAARPRCARAVAFLEHVPAYRRNAVPALPERGGVRSAAVAGTRPATGGERTGMHALRTHGAVRATARCRWDEPDRWPVLPSR